MSLRIRPSRTGFGLDESAPAAPWVVANALLQRAEPAYEGLEPELRSLAERAVADVGPEAEPLVATFRFLAALAAVRLGAMRLVWRGERDGRPVVVVASLGDGAEYRVDDPQLGEAEDDRVDELIVALTAPSGCAPPPLSRPRRRQAASALIPAQIPGGSNCLPALSSAAAPSPSRRPASGRRPVARPNGPAG